MLFQAPLLVHCVPLITFRLQEQIIVPHVLPILAHQKGHLFAVMMDTLLHWDQQNAPFVLQDIMRQKVILSVQYALLELFLQLKEQQYAASATVLLIRMKAP